MDRQDRVVFVEFSGEEVLKLEFLDFFSEGFDVLADLLKENLSAFFVEDPEGLFEVGQFVFDGLKGSYSAFKPGFLLEQLLCLFLRRPDLFTRKFPLDLLYFPLLLADIKDNLGELRSWPSTKRFLP